MFVENQKILITTIADVGMKMMMIYIWVSSGGSLDGLVEEVCGGSPLFFIPIFTDRVF